MRIVLSAVLALFILGCSEKSDEQNKHLVETNETKQAIVADEPLKETIVQEQKAVEPSMQEVKEPVVEKKEVPKPEPVVVEKKVAKAPVKQEVVKEAVVVKETAPVAKIDGGALFAKCAACHGQNAEKSALGKSQIIKGWNVDKLMAAFQGYKDGSYGGAMKGVMKSQVANLSKDELKALAAYISKL